MASKPWASGPREILEHGVGLLQKDSDANRRLAFLSIDNAVELIAKTFLGLPKRINGLSLTRKDVEEFSNSFPVLMDALEKYVADRIKGIGIGEIEWYHRLRNQLYHNGNGLTVERAKVENYAGIAIRLFETLFEEKLAVEDAKGPELVADFLAVWSDLQDVLSQWYARYTGSVMAGANTPRQLAKKGVISRETAEAIEKLQRLRNMVAHGELITQQPSATEHQVEKAKEIIRELNQKQRES